MIETIFILLTAHFLGDFALQTDWIMERKKQPHVLFMHAGIVTAASALMLGSTNMLLFLILFGSHLALDALKVYWLPNGIYMFLLDQLVHIVVIIVLAFAFSDAAQTGFWLTRLAPDNQRWYLLLVTFLGGFLLCVPTGGVLIGVATSPLLEEIKEEKRKRRQRQQEQGHNNEVDYDDGAEKDDIEGLRRGGRYIGWLERSLVMMLLLIGQAEGIGFLFAAKSILRFGEIKDSQQRKMAEYIIIGSFLSFGWALLTSYLTQQALTLW